MSIGLLLSSVLGFVIPHLKDTLLHWQAPSWLKSSVIWILSALAGAIPQVVYSGDIGDYVLSILAAMVVAAGTDYLSGQDTDKPRTPLQMLTRGQGWGKPASITTAEQANRTQPVHRESQHGRITR